MEDVCSTVVVIMWPIVIQWRFETDPAAYVRPLLPTAFSVLGIMSMRILSGFGLNVNGGSAVLFMG